MNVARRLVPVVFVLTLGVFGAAPASAALCKLQELNIVLADYIELGSTTQTCDWRGRFEPTFTPWSNGGSENRPVVAAAIKLYADGDTAATNWWTTFLKNQLGDLDELTLPLKVRRFHGSELFASGYDAHTSRAVAVAHLWGQQCNNPTIQGLAKRWLRATWFTYALAAAPAPAEWLYSIGNTTVEKALPDITKANEYVQVPSPRSSDEGHQGVISVFARARNFTMKQALPNELKRIQTLIEARWVGSSPNVYGLTSGDRTTISGIVNSGTGVTSSLLQSVYGNAKMLVNFHFLAFADGTRVAVMEPNGANSLHPKIIFASKVAKDANNKWTATLLAPWWGDSNGVGSSSFSLSTRTVTATGDFTRTLSMPGTNVAIVYNVKLGMTGVSLQ